MRRQTKRNKRTQHIGGMNRLEKVRKTIRKSYEGRKDQRAKSKKRMNLEKELGLRQLINMLSQSRDAATDRGVEQPIIDRLNAQIRDLDIILKGRQGMELTPMDEIQIALGAAGDVAMDSFREGKKALANKAGEQGQAATQAAAVAAAEFFRRMNDMWGSLKSPPVIKPQIMIEDGPQPPQ